MLDNRSDLLIPHGILAPSWSALLHSQAYATLMEVAAARMPAETVGVLLGEARDSGDGTIWLEVQAVAPVRLAYERSGLVPVTEEWEGIKSRLSEAADARMSVIGWFYADPGIGIFEPRVDIAEVQRTLAADLSLFLLVHPSRDQGAFYVWQDGNLTPAGGFYEALPDESAAPLIHWQGSVSGSAKWLGPTGLLSQVALPDVSNACDESDASSRNASWVAGEGQGLGHAPIVTQSPTDLTEATELIVTAPSYLPAAAYLADPFSERLHTPDTLIAHLRGFGAQENRRRAWLGIVALLGIALIAILAAFWSLNSNTDPKTLSGLSQSQPSPTAQVGAISLFASPSAASLASSASSAAKIVAEGTPSQEAGPTSTPVLLPTERSTSTVELAPTSTPVPALDNTAVPTPTATLTPQSPPPPTSQPAKPASTPTSGPTLHPTVAPTSTPALVATSARPTTLRLDATLTPPARNTSTTIPVPTSTTLPAPSNTPVSVPTDTSAPRPTSQATNTAVSARSATALPVDTPTQPLSSTPVHAPTDTPQPIPTSSALPTSTEPPDITPTSTIVPLPTFPIP